MAGPMRQTQIASAVMQGGLNLSAPPLSLDPGEAIQLHNYEVTELGRYRRVMGYERFDGRLRPSEQPFVGLVVSNLTSFDVGETVTGAGGATGKIAAKDSTFLTLCLVACTGTFVNGETVTCTGGSATVTSPPYTNGTPDDALDDTFRIATADYFRALIQVVPGSGPIRGVVTYKGDVYAFRNNAGGTACVMHKATTGGWTTVTTPALVAGGDYKFDIGNFTGSAGTLVLCGVDGKNKAFRYDGTTFTQLSTGMGTDTPVALAILPSKILVLGYANASLMLSKIGDPTDFTVVSGGAEIAVADEVRGLQVQPNSVLAVFCKRSIQILSGKTPATMELTTLVEELSIVAGTVQPMGDSVFLADSGVTRLARVQEFGDFKDVPLSVKLNPLIYRYRGQAAVAFTVRDKQQYRLCYPDGTGIIMSFVGPELAGCSTFNYGIPIRCAYSGQSSTGQEQIYFGSDDGYVYQAEKGYSFDGDAISAVCRPAYNFVKTPELRKRFKKLVLEVDTPRKAALMVQPELDYSGPESPEAAVEHVAMNTVAAGGGGFYDAAIWNEVFWSATAVYLVEMYLSGVAENISVVVYSSALNEQPHTINSMLIHWSPRARSR